MILASVLFGLMHWNERNETADRAIYAGFSMIAGLFYGVTFRLGGSAIISSVIIHTVTDTVWEVLS